MGLRRAAIALLVAGALLSGCAGAGPAASGEPPDAEPLAVTVSAEAAQSATPRTAPTVQPSATASAATAYASATPVALASASPTDSLTAVPAALAPLPGAPGTWEELEPWLAQAWAERRDPAEVRAGLVAAGWQEHPGEWAAAELTGDLRDEWILALRDVPALAAGADLPITGVPGNLWVVGEGGLLYRHHAGIDLLSREPGLMPELVGLADMDGDGGPELVLQDTECGAHTCYGYFQVIGSRDGALRNLVEGGGTFPGVIEMSYPDVRLVEAEGGARLYIHGGSIGSVGAGIVRAYTETWAWDASAAAVRWQETALDASEYRHHWLYEAMEQMDAGRYAEAEATLLAVLEDEALIVEPFMEDTPGETEAAIAQFAGFRLVLNHLLQGDRAEAERRASWLAYAYPGAPLSQAATRLVAGWTGPGGLDALCGELQIFLEGYPEATGPLEYMGYGNPSLTSGELCTW